MGTSVTKDRVLIGACAAIYLVLLGVSVAAVVALVDLGRGFHKAAGNPHTGLLYVIIGVSALIILAAIPVLLRARRPAGGPARRATAPPRRPVRANGATEGRQSGNRGAAGWASAVPEEAVDRIWLRGATVLVGALGVALVAVAAATYLMAVGKDGAAWGGYGVAGVITAAAPVIPWLQLRQLRDLRAKS